MPGFNYLGCFVIDNAANELSIENRRTSGINFLGRVDVEDLCSTCYNLLLSVVFSSFFKFCRLFLKPALLRSRKTTVS